MYYLVIFCDWIFCLALDTFGKKTLITLMQPSAAQRVAVAPFSRDLLSQPLWRCI